MDDNFNADFYLGLVTLGPVALVAYAAAYSQTRQALASLHNVVRSFQSWRHGVGIALWAVFATANLAGVIAALVCSASGLAALHSRSGSGGDVELVKAIIALVGLATSAFVVAAVEQIEREVDRSRERRAKRSPHDRGAQGPPSGPNTPGSVSRKGPGRA